MFPPQVPRSSPGGAESSGGGQEARGTATGAVTRPVKPAPATVEGHAEAGSRHLEPAEALRSPAVRHGTATGTSAVAAQPGGEEARDHHHLHVAAPPEPAAVLVGEVAGEKGGTEACTADVAPAFSTVKSSEVAAYEAGPPKPELSTSVVRPVAEPTAVGPKVGGGRVGGSSACPSPLPVQGEHAAANGANVPHGREMARVSPPSQPNVSSSSLPAAAAAGSKIRESQGRAEGTGEQGADGVVAAESRLTELSEESSSITTDLAAFGSRDRAFAAVGCNAASVPLSAIPRPRDV